MPVVRDPRLAKLYKVHDQLRVAILGQPWQVRKDLEGKKKLVEDEIRRILNAREPNGINSRSTSPASV